jgi:acetyltransferase
VKDKETKCVIIYIESLKKGKEFMKVCKKSKKPVFVLKAGTSKAGERAAQTHTGALTGSDEVYSAAFKQCGARRVDSLVSLLKVGNACEKNGLVGEKALVITNAGGPGILMTDLLAKGEVRIPKLPKDLINELNRRLIGVSWSKNNPIDVVGDALADRYSRVFNKVKKYKFYDYVIVLLTPQAMTQPLKTASEIVKFAKIVKKPVFPCFLGGTSLNKARDYMRKQGLTVFDEINELARTVSALKS